MLTIKTDDGSMHKFDSKDYTEYTITNDYVVVKRNEQWIGAFAREHFVSLVVL